MSTVALTFDDGPYPSTTHALLAALGEVRATFFLWGEHAEAHPDLVRAIAGAGHVLGNHTWTHPRLTTLDPAARDREISRTQELLESLTGVRPVLFRPPYGDTDPAVASAAAAQGLTEVLWSVDTRDWADAPADEIVTAASAVEPGGVVLMHEGRPATVEAVPRVLAALAARGVRPSPVRRP
ncbi:polysaccharide deacetylase family protein [Amycolatopsis sp. SID8362]|uniref:polysaccharide deacetylase family protein n=1 Tax=Amycolatopsis sp. SID8362 TaxID=2690346 RepID=UPI00136D351D|nr:polysaccharide deacetylase family protein [Amycolatopsis sp. SID8362]NBH10843.1 polysaccharide deacetylase family protein [Amycolatopsis sp. SID8362]NED47536.1 polysaccharide deacetylase family protein [Amycolatopsis sp. SID8362]